MADRADSQASTTPTAIDRDPAHAHGSPNSSSEKQTSDKKERPMVAIQQPTSNDTTNDALFYDEPPPLNYTIKTGRILLLILFYSLYWGAHLSTTKNLAIITSLIGTVSGFKFAQRMWFLWFARNHISWRPIGAGRWGVDFFQFILSLAMATFFVPLIVGSSVMPGDPRITAMVLPCIMLVLTLPLLVTGLFPYHIHAPWHISSFPPHQLLPPLGYCYIEDIVAVDGGGCTEFRQLSVTWGATGLIIAAGLLIACWTASIDMGYGLGYGVLWLWALLMAVGSIAHIHHELMHERREWKGRVDNVHRTRRLRICEGKYDPPALPTTMDEGIRWDLDIWRMLDWQEVDADAVRAASDGSWWICSQSSHARTGVVSSPTPMSLPGAVRVDEPGSRVMSPAKPEAAVTGPRGWRSASPVSTSVVETSPV
ncbi:hypothetical protein DAEQUDRAFT_770748 [Daedalea quercina L-15889]|uniref:Uncharacterized protein n=1 Tax=Daedalea quercina L-15889 TaxID=1314783 RepID=A0A165KL74_9APHY|nr:hypothetical protein DAEQUDRAFT_770748 [Daedalea quercina L-15889]